MNLLACRLTLLSKRTAAAQLQVVICRFAATQRLSAYKTKEVVDAYDKLGLSPDHEIGPIEVREAFFRLAKRYHPDTGSREADARKFADVKDAYQIVMESGTVEGVGTPNARPEGYEDPSVTDDIMAEFARKYDIRHTAPQHRQYLSFDGFGRGSPMQRSRQHEKHRVEMAAAKAVEYRVEKIAWQDEKSAIVVDKKRTKDVKTRMGMERVVEDLIQESMQKGDFDVIKGKGKPLKPTAENPYTDFMTTKINEILINNGYQPEWVELGKEIRRDTQEAKDRLLFARCSLGATPLDEKDEKAWEVHVKQFEQEWKKATEKIKKFNLLVPTLNQQIIPSTAEKEIKKILLESKPILRTAQINPVHGDIHNDAHKHFGLSSPMLSHANVKDRPHGAAVVNNIPSDDANCDSPMELFHQMIRYIFRWKPK